MNALYLINFLIGQDPELAKIWNTCNRLLNGKSEQQGIEIINNLAQQAGLTPQQAEQGVKQVANELLNR